MLRIRQGNVAFKQKKGGGGWGGGGWGLGGLLATVHEESSQTQLAFQPLTGTFAGSVV